MTYVCKSAAGAVDHLRRRAGRRGRTGVALRLGVHRNTVRNWELGHSDPGLSDFLAWAHLMGLSVTLSPREEA
jgi:hypothetical protein